MDSVHLEPIVYQIRLFTNGNSYNNRDPFDGVAILQVSGSTGIISGMFGKFTRQHWKEFAKVLHSKGISTVLMERNGKVKEVSVKKELEKC